MDGGNARYEVPVSGKQIKVPVLYLLSLRINKRTLQVVIPGKPVRVRPVPDLGVIVAYKVVM